MITENHAQSRHIATYCDILRGQCLAAKDAYETALIRVEWAQVEARARKLEKGTPLLLPRFEDSDRYMPLE